MLGAVHRTISGHLLTRAGVTQATCHTGAVTLIQRFGSALNLNVHLHMIFVDGVYLTGGVGPPVFRPVPSPGYGRAAGTGAADYRTHWPAAGETRRGRARRRERMAER